MTKWTTTLAALVLLFSTMWFGCGNGGVAGVEVGEIQHSPLEISFSAVEVGATGVEILTLTNVDADETLVIRAVELRPGDGGHIDQLSLVNAPDEALDLEPGESLVVEVEYSPEVDAPANRGEIVVRNSDPRYSESPLIVPVVTLGNNPEFFAQPPVVRFQRRQVGESTVQNLEITNIGRGAMTVFEEPNYAGGGDFRVLDTGRTYPLEIQPYDPVGAQVSPQDFVLEIPVQYQPLGDGADTGTIQVRTNDVLNPPAAPGEMRLHEIDVVADAEAPCIEVDGRTRNLGQVPIGEVAREVITLNNCGSETLRINAVDVEVDEFGVYRLNLGSWDQTGDGAVDQTVSLNPGASDTFVVEFVPLEEGTRRAEVVISSNDPIQPRLTIDVVARGAEGSCPTAVALASLQGVPLNPSASITAAPLDQVILDGTESTDEDGDVVGWEWEILEIPPGINIDLEPLPSDPQNTDQSRRTFQPLTAGLYRFGLTVEDETGFRSCNMAEVQITAIPDQNIHIELTWTNPEDPDETNDVGSDLDIHLSKMGPGAWFEAPFSIWYLNPNVSEDPIWNPEDPSLDIDVTDGAGPENITMRNPEGCQWYAVGVHYFQKRFGTAYATIRIYINGDLRFYRPYFALEETGHFWDVARIHWNAQTSSATVVGVDGFYPIPPTGQAPEITDDMIASGLCTAEGLY